MLKWWQRLAQNDKAQVSALLAIKLYSIVPNSMCDERTGSTFTWLNSALRNRQKVPTLVDMVQVRQWYLFNPETEEATKVAPSVRWRDMKTPIFGSTPVDAYSDEVDDGTSDSEDDESVGPEGDGLTTKHLFPEVNLAAPMLKDFLAVRSDMVETPQTTVVTTPSQTSSEPDWAW
ncbi:hypothetical protein K439DRAFT_1662869 [Ramaria rubella]|nr:hypothetical protein K439DRAFT_1662869 [Ramaria rubella]